MKIERFEDIEAWQMDSSTISKNMKSVKRPTLNLEP